MLFCYHVNTSVEVNIRTGVFISFSAYAAVCGACPDVTTVVLVSYIYLLFLQIPLFATLEYKMLSLNCNVNNT